MGEDPGSIPMDDPQALFLTWTASGSWLPGDERGWSEKPGRFSEPDAKRDLEDVTEQGKSRCEASGGKIHIGEPDGVNPRIVRRRSIRGVTSPARLANSFLPFALVEIVNRDIALCEVSNRVDNDAVGPNNKDRSMGWFGT